MSARSPAFRRDPDDSADPRLRLGRGRRGVRFRFSLPSPLLLTAVLVFVVLPLLWPALERQPVDPSARAAFQMPADVTDVAVSDDGRRMAAICRARPVWTWERDSQSSSQWSLEILPEHESLGSRCVTMDPAGSTLAVGNLDGTVSLWSLTDDRRLAVLPAGEDMVLALAFSDDGRVLATANVEAEIRLWDVAARRQVGLLRSHQGPVTTLAFAPDGRLLASGSEDGTIRLWNLDDLHGGAGFVRDEGFVLGAGSIVLAVAFSPDGRLLASSSLSDHGARLWDLGARSTLGVLRGDMHSLICIRFTADSRNLIGGDEHGRVSLWGIDQAAPKAAFRAHKGWVKSLALASSGQTLITGGNDGYIRLWDISRALPRGS